VLGPDEPSAAFAPWVRSTLPRKTAFSSTASLNARTSPSTTLPALNSTRPLATILPCSRPRIRTSLAVRSAATFALGPIVRRPSERLIVPSNCPSTTRSSLPFSSPESRQFFQFERDHSPLPLWFFLLRHVFEHLQGIKTVCRRNRRRSRPSYHDPLTSPENPKALPELYARNPVASIPETRK